MRNSTWGKSAEKKFAVAARRRRERENQNTMTNKYLNNHENREEKHERERGKSIENKVFCPTKKSEQFLCKSPNQASLNEMSKNLLGNSFRLNIADRTMKFFFCRTNKKLKTTTTSSAMLLLLLLLLLIYKSCDDESNNTPHHHHLDPRYWELVNEKNERKWIFLATAHKRGAQEEPLRKKNTQKKCSIHRLFCCVRWDFWDFGSCFFGLFFP